MAITFTWSIKDMHRKAATGAVYRVDRSGSYLHTNDDGDPATPDHTASDFIAYASLDEATVLGWVKDNGVQAYNEGLITSNITNIITAAAANSSGTPWAAE